MRTTSYLISDARSGRAISRMTAAPSRPSPPSTSRGLRRSQARSRGPLARGSRGSVPTAVRAPGRTCWAWLWAKGSCCSRPRAEGCNPTCHWGQPARRRAGGGRWLRPLRAGTCGLRSRPRGREEPLAWYAPLCSAGRGRGVRGGARHMKHPSLVVYINMRCCV